MITHINCNMKLLIHPILQRLCLNIKSPYKTHLKPKSWENSFAYMICCSCPNVCWNFVQSTALLLPRYLKLRRILDIYHPPHKASRLSQQGNHKRRQQTNDVRCETICRLHLRWPGKMVFPLFWMSDWNRSYRSMKAKGIWSSICTLTNQDIKLHFYLNSTFLFMAVSANGLYDHSESSFVKQRYSPSCSQWTDDDRRHQTALNHWDRVTHICTRELDHWRFT